MFNSFSNFLDIFFIFFPFSILCFFTFYPLIEGNIYINVKVSNCDDSMISMEYFSIIRTERTRKRENFWILRLQQRIGKFPLNYRKRKILRNLISHYFFLDCTRFIPKALIDRASFSRIGYHASRGRKTRIKENLFSSRGEIKIALTSATRHARKSILHARCAPGIIGNWNFTGRRLVWHLTAISPHRYVRLRRGKRGRERGKWNGSLLFRMDVSRGAQATQPYP